MKILFVHEVSYMKKPIFEMHEFPEALASLGHQIHFIELDEGRRFWRDPSRNPTETIRGRVNDSVFINLHRPRTLGVPGLDRIIAVFTVMPILARLLRREQFDCVVLYSVPTFGFQTLLYSRAQEIPVLFRSIDVSHKIRRSVFSPVIKLVEKIVYRKVDMISAHNEPLLEYCTALAGKSCEGVVRNPIVNLKYFQPQAPTSRIDSAEDPSNSTRTLIYVGTLFPFSGMIEALRVFRDTAPNNVRLVILGQGPLKKRVQRFIHRHRLETRVDLGDFVPFDRLGAVISNADLAINTLNPSLVTDLALPNKVLKYLACGVPVVSTNLRGLRSVVGELQNIWWADDSTSVMQIALDRALTLDRSSRIESLCLVHPFLEAFSPQSAGLAFEQDLIQLANRTVV